MPDPLSVQQREAAKAMEDVLDRTGGGATVEELAEAAVAALACLSQGDEGEDVEADDELAVHRGIMADEARTRCECGHRDDEHPAEQGFCCERCGCEMLSTLPGPPPASVRPVSSPEPTDEAIERAAKALHGLRKEDPRSPLSDWSSLSENYKARFRGMARACLSAARSEGDEHA